MQSLSRAISRGNAVLTFSSVHKRVEPIHKRATPEKSGMKLSKINYWIYRISIG